MDKIKIEDSIYVLDRLSAHHKLEIIGSKGLLKLYGYGHKNIIDMSNADIENYSNVCDVEYIESYDINKWINDKNFDEYSSLLTIITTIPISETCIDIIKTRDIAYVCKKN